MALRPDDLAEDTCEVTAPSEEIDHFVPGFHARKCDGFGGLAVNVAHLIGGRPAGIHHRRVDKGGDGLRSAGCRQRPEGGQRKRGNAKSQEHSPLLGNRNRQDSVPL